MKNILYPALFIALLSLPTVADAQTKRLYFAGYAGLSLLNDLDFSDNDTPATGSFEPDNAVNFAGALGLRFNKNFRMEAELSYRSADIENADISGTGSTDVDGDFNTTALLLNGYYDFNVKNWKTQPYVTAGLGIARHSGSINDSNAFTQNVDDTDYNFLWNVGTGLKYRVKDNFAWTAGYRYLDGADFDLGNTEIDYSAHEIRVGLEWDLAWD